MPTAALRQITAKQDNQALRARLEAEAGRVQISYKASVIDFMVMEGIQDFSKLDYATRKSFEAYLKGQSGMKYIRHHLLAFDKLKQHALSQGIRVLEDGKVARPRYENGILYLPYHPDPKVSAMFRNSTRKNEHVWDFSRNAPERMKRQVFDILHYELENSTSPEGRRVHLLGLRDLYDFNNKIVVIKPEVLRREYRRATCQLKLCTGGFGAYPRSRGSACFCIDLYTGKESRYERMDILGIMEQEKLPGWAKHGLLTVQQERAKKEQHKGEKEAR